MTLDFVPSSVPVAGKRCKGCRDCREGIMTDYQFKSIIKMATQIVENSKDIETASKALREILGEEKKEEGKNDE